MAKLNWAILVLQLVGCLALQHLQASGADGYPRRRRLTILARA